MLFQVRQGDTGLATGAGAGRSFFALALLISVCLTGACARKVRVEISSLAEHEETRQAGQLAGRRCLVLPARPDVSADDLQFREFSAQVSTSLALKDCAPAQGLEDADLAVFLHYGIGDPIIVEQHGYLTYRSWRRRGRGMADFPVTTTYVFHACSLSLEARLVDKATAPPAGTKKRGASSGQPAEAGAKPGRQVWKVDATHIGPQNDLRVLFPWLLAAAKEYYGVDSGQTVLVKVGVEDLIASPPGPDAP